MIEEKFEVLPYYNSFFRVITQIGFIIASFIIFILLYKFMPKHKVSFKSQILGAGISSFLLTIVSYIFSNFLYIFKDFSITYGSLTTLMLIMMWTYSCFYIILFGAELNKLFMGEN